MREMTRIGGGLAAYGSIRGVPPRSPGRVRHGPVPRRNRPICHDVQIEMPLLGLADAPQRSFPSSQNFAGAQAAEGVARCLPYLFDLTGESESKRV